MIYLRRFAIIALALAGLPLAAQNVDRTELESVKGKKVEFVNYVGPHKVVDTKEQIYGLGASLGSPIAKSAARSGSLDRYAVIHAVDPSVLTGFDADIIVLGKDAGVDHIRNLRWIVSGYLSAAYGYSRADGDLLAQFITVYNAVYRSDLDYFQARYKKVVMGHLSKENAGLALRWDEWAGKTRIVVPLTGKAGKGGLGTVDTGSLTETKVIQEVRKADDKAIEPRKDMVDLKEREIAAATADIAKAKEDIAAKEAALAKEKADIAAAEKALADEKAKAAADTGAKTTDIGPGQEAGVTVTGADTDIAEKEADLAARKDAVAAADTAVEAAKETVRKDEAAVEAKKADVTTERAAIASDVNAAIKAEVAGTATEAAKPASTGTFLEALSLDSPMARLVSVDLNSGGTVKKSELNTIRSRTLTESSGTYFCVAGSTKGTAAVRLVSLDGSTLAVKAEGADDLFVDSVLALKDGVLYAVVSRGGAYFLGSFGQDLALKSISGSAVHPYTALTFRTEGLAVQLASGGFAFLDPADLKTKKTLK